jgi:hypothetical protein
VGGMVEEDGLKEAEVSAALEKELGKGKSG